MIHLKTILLAFVTMLLAWPAAAGKLQIAPVSIDVAAPAAATSIKIKNAGRETMTIQARIFNWHQAKGGDKLLNTRNVVVSPPIVKLKPGKQAVVRIVRISKTPVKGEESYRLIVDELPSKVKQQRRMIRMVMRYSIPVFFGAADATRPKTAWAVYQQKGRIVVSAANRGSKRMKLSRMKITDSAGRSVSFGQGLNGYILGGSAKFFATNAARRLGGRKVTITAHSNFGPFKTVAHLK